jgi:hypothetical protein
MMNRCPSSRKADAGSILSGDEGSVLQDLRQDALGGERRILKHTPEFPVNIHIRKRLSIFKPGSFFEHFQMVRRHVVGFAGEKRDHAVDAVVCAPRFRMRQCFVDQVGCDGLPPGDLVALFLGQLIVSLDFGTIR